MHAKKGVMGTLVVTRALSVWKAPRAEAPDIITFHLPRVYADRAPGWMPTTLLAETGARQTLCATCVYSHVVRG